MIRQARVFFDSHHPGGSEIGLPTAATGQITRCPARFVINDPISFNLLNLTKIRMRKVITFLRQIVICRIDLGGQNSFSHGMTFSTENHTLNIFPAPSWKAENPSARPPGPAKRSITGILLSMPLLMSSSQTVSPFPSACISAGGCWVFREEYIQ